MESLIGESALKKVSFNYEAAPMESWDRKSFVQYCKAQKTDRKLMKRVRNRELEEDMLEAPQRITEVDIEADDGEYEEFKKNTFPDVMETFDEERLYEEQ